MISLGSDAKLIIKTLQGAGFRAYAVGGSVRDTIMGRATKGWDFTTDAKPEEILSLFPDSFYDNQFGTVGIKIKDKDEVVDIYEVTTYRSEKGYSDHRHPDQITWGKTLEEDLARRDFTINAIATDGKTLTDPYGGQKDIAQKLIRAVGVSEERFKEDALRMMRAVRIAAELGFAIEEHTLSAIQTHATLLQKISAERVRDELLRILTAEFAGDAILTLKNTGLLMFVLPEFETAFAVNQKSPKRHHIYDVGTHSLMALRHCPSRDPIVRLATLLHDIGKPKTHAVDNNGIVTFYNHEVVGAKIAKTIAARLRLSKKQTERLITLIRWHQFTVDERQTDTAIRRFIRRVGKENLNDILALRIGDRLGGGALETSWRLELFKKRLEDVQVQPFSISDLTVNGYDVMEELRAKPGPVVGRVLKAAFEEVEKGTLPNTREDLLQFIRSQKGDTDPASP